MADDPDARPGDAATAHAVLSDLPASLWPATLRALRRVLGERDRAELPAVVRPFARWKPDRLAASRPRLALAQALAQDAGLRAALGEAVEGEAPEADADLERLIERLGEERAVTHLIVASRWQDLSVLAARVAEREAAAHDAVAEEGGGSQRAHQEAELERLREELAQLRRERGELREALAAARQRAQAAESDRDALRAQRDAVAAERDDARGRLREAHARHRDREQRLRRRAEQAEALARVDVDRVEAAAEELDALAAALRTAVGRPGGGQAGATRPGGEQTGATRPGGEQAGATRPAQGPAMRASPPSEPGRAPAGDPRPDGPAGGPRPEAPPRGPRPAQPGRPCQLPPGARRDRAEGVLALLQVHGLTLLLDGYNVTKHPLGRPTLDLAAQRDWLVQQAAALGSRFPAHPVVVFDATEPQAGTRPAARGVRVVFTEGDELADDRIVALVDGLDAQAPACVVTSDREVAEACRARRADVVPTDAFLAALP